MADQTARPTPALPARPSAQAPTGPVLRPAPQPGPAADGASPPATPGTTAPKPARENPFGVMLPTKLARTPEGMRLAKDLSAVSWSNPLDTSPPASRPWP